MNVQRLQLPVSSSNCSLPSSCSSIQSHSILLQHGKYHSPVFSSKFRAAMCVPFLGVHHPCGRRGRRPPSSVVFVGAEETEVLVDDGNTGEAAAAASGDREEPEPATEDQEYVDQIRRVLELLRKNRDMLFSEVKLTIMIEDLREDERRRLLGIDGSKAPTRDDLVAALEDVNEGRIPNNRMALRMLAEEMISWPNLEVEAPKKRPKSKSPYAKATDTGVDPQVAAKQRNIDWDSAAEIDELNVADDMEVPQAVGYGALYVVTAFPIIIGCSLER
ncbi:hypothetical protein Nepgr_029563 [Nepenthes gracilis]|uniref:Uncharacterized protein n=1 Tax=Nepenthes gracilis TaxID=150966 RepID=A0AAD3Y4Y7_NEPGR|nr:hypothetical protein Nepgr_029563 [Nepenthes gracilis]